METEKYNYGRIEFSILDFKVSILLNFILGKSTVARHNLEKLEAKRSGSSQREPKFPFIWGSSSIFGE